MYMQNVWSSSVKFMQQLLILITVLEEINLNYNIYV
jgi:hypothetical protein